MVWFRKQELIMKQKIVLEVVPWVDKKLARGWTTENRKSLSINAKHLP
jgi:hypothetical protein